jgi:hypothetical protein
MPTIYWLSPDIDRWRLQREGAHHAERLFSDHDEAVKWARRHAQAHAPCRLKIQGHSGRVREQIDFAATSGVTVLDTLASRFAR